MVGMIGCVARLAAAFAAEPDGAGTPEGTPTRAEAPAIPADSPAPAQVAPASPQEVLDDAIGLYVQGKSSEARRRLQQVLGMGPDVPPSVRQKALAYLGEILFKPEDTHAALPVFEALLDEAPDYVMDPFEHPPDVCAYVEDLRESRRPEAIIPPKPPVAPVERGPFPIWSLMPGGVYYYVHKEPGVGIAVGGAQLAVFATNAVLYVHLGAIKPSAEGDTEAAAEWNAWQTATNVTGALTIASLVLPAAVETSRWLSQPRARTAQRVRHAVDADVMVTPGGVAMRGSF